MTPGRLPAKSIVLLLAAALIVTAGCGRVYYFGEDDLRYFQNAATSVEWPQDRTPSLQSVAETMPPRTLSDPGATTLWDLPLEEAVRITLVNNRVLRGATGGAGGVVGGFGAAGGVFQGGATPTIYDVAIQESNVGFGSQGTEAALAAFDAQFRASMLWQRNERILNNVFFGGGVNILQQDAAGFRGELTKPTATGATFSLAHTVDYGLTNSPANLFPSAYNTTFELGVRQPLLQGAGVDVNRIVGPIPQNAQGLPLTGYNGPAIARIRTDQQIVQFEAAVIQMLRDVENTYWELYYAYRSFEAQVAGRDSALRTWRDVKAQFDAGRASASQEAEAREQYFRFRALMEDALNNIYDLEGTLRRIMGLPTNDGRLIRPSDEPTRAPYRPDWYSALAEALMRRVEVRSRQWEIKQRELEYLASRTFLLPRLDAIAQYRINGFGDRLLGGDDDVFVGGTNVGFANAYETMTEGNYTDWALGLEMSIPIGFRQGWAAVRNAELRLARARALMQDEELEIAHRLSEAFRSLDRSYTTSQTNFNRLLAAQRQLEDAQRLYEAGRRDITLDDVLRAQRNLAEAEAAYYRSLVDYNLAIMQVQIEKGALLDYHAVVIGEGPWPHEAYVEAYERARARGAGIPLDYPEVDPDPHAVPYPGRMPPIQPMEGFMPPAPIEGAPPPLLDSGEAGVSDRAAYFAPAAGGGAGPSDL